MMSVDPNKPNYYISVVVITLLVAIPEWFRFELGTIMQWVLSIVVYVELAFCLLISWFVYKFGTGITPETINVDTGEGDDASLDFVRSFEKEEGPTHYFFTKLRNILFLTILFMSTVVLIPMIKNDSVFAMGLVILTSALCFTGIFSALKAYKVALRNLARKIEIV